MTIHFDHTIVGVRDKHATAAYLSELLGLPPAVPYGPFLMHSFGNGAHVHFADSQTPPTSTHLAFRAGEEDFTAVLDRLRLRGIQHWADPFKAEPDALYTDGPDRGFYWDDPDGHVLELITRPAPTRAGSRVGRGS
jgi:catechol 2,3-dioxygenase-like lactoylglutathione lyase family enzyme